MLDYIKENNYKQIKENKKVIISVINCEKKNLAKNKKNYEEKIIDLMNFFIGKGYRVYYKDLTNVVIIIIAGSDKGNQKRVIKQAEKYLEDFIERNSK